MTDVLAIVKARLQRDLGSSTAEWQLVESLLNEYVSQQETILRWVYAELPGYVGTRVQAGQRFIAAHPDEGWQILERLIQSNDPDDRDTGLSLLIELHDPRGPAIAQSMLRDPWPYLRFDAIDYLKNIYPVKAREALDSLLRGFDQSITGYA